MRSCSAWCMIARRVSKPNICRLLMLHCLCQHGCEPEFPCFKHFLVFACLWVHGWRLRCTHTVHSLTCVSVVVCVAHKLRPCPNYSRRRDRIILVLWRSLYKVGGGGGGLHFSLSQVCDTQGVGAIFIGRGGKKVQMHFFAFFCTFHFEPFFALFALFCIFLHLFPLPCHSCFRFFDVCDAARSWCAGTYK